MARSRDPETWERSWPDLGVPRERFLRHLAALRSEGGDLFVDDLYLAFACGLGLPAALAAFEREFVPRVRGFAARVDAAPSFVEEVVQQVRTKLFTPRDGAPGAIAMYSARAPLGSWLRTVVVRTARELAQRDRKLTRLDTPVAQGLRAGEPDPELEFMKRRSRAAFDAALERALASLDDRGRTLLRLHFVEDMTHAAIGRMYHVADSTVTRWLAQLRKQIVRELAAEMRVSESELARVAAFVHSRLGAHLSSYLAPRRS